MITFLVNVSLYIIFASVLWSILHPTPISFLIYRSKHKSVLLILVEGLLSLFINKLVQLNSVIYYQVDV